MTMTILLGATTASSDTVLSGASIMREESITRVVNTMRKASIIANAFLSTLTIRLADDMLKLKRD